MKVLKLISSAFCDDSAVPLALPSVPLQAVPCAFGLAIAAGQSPLQCP